MRRLKIILIPVNSLTFIESHCNLFPSLRTISEARAFIGALYLSDVDTSYCKEDLIADSHIDDLKRIAINRRM